MRSDRAVWEEIQELSRGRYWRGEYERVKADRDRWRLRAEAAEARVEELEQLAAGLQTENAELRARVSYLEREVFGRKTEQRYRGRSPKTQSSAPSIGFWGYDPDFPFR